jgi:hypothetical protein
MNSKLYEPLYILATNNNNNSLDNEAAVRTMHIAYTTSPDLHFFIATITDDRGELLQSFALPLQSPSSSPSSTTTSTSTSTSSSAERVRWKKELQEKLWEYCSDILLSTSTVSRWRIAICKIGILLPDELAGTPVKCLSVLMSERRMEATAAAICHLEFHQTLCSAIPRCQQKSAAAHQQRHCSYCSGAEGICSVP